MIANPRSDRFHVQPVSLLGGLACILGLLGATVAWIVMNDLRSPDFGTGTGLFAAALIGLAGFLILGLLDDRRSIAPWWKGTAQGLILIVVLWIWSPEGRLDSPIYLCLAWLCAMIMINAWNYLDHADGTFAVTSCLSSAFLAYALIAVLGAGLLVGALWGICGAMIGFLFWNAPRAKVFLGDAGSLPLGFLLTLASLVILDRGGLMLLPVALAAHCVPFTDILLVTASRLLAGKNPLHGGLDHSGHRLSTILSPRATLRVLILAGAIFGAIGLSAIALDSPATAAALPALCLFLAALLSRITPPRSQAPDGVERT